MLYSTELCPHFIIVNMSPVKPWHQYHRPRARPQLLDNYLHMAQHAACMLSEPATGCHDGMRSCLAANWTGSL
jgi:hypothetical protein